MTTSTPVPSDVDAESIIDLVHDCREVAGVLGSFGTTTVRLPGPHSEVPVEISPDAVSALAGYDEYGS